jgi:UTP--glucose-1-phosphate uridylyltransferase
MRLQSEKLIKTKMRARGLSDPEIEDFIHKAVKASGESAFVPLSEVEVPGQDFLVSLDQDDNRLRDLEKKGLEVLKHLLVIKLNGGRSTTMGGSVPKGILEAKDGLSYLEIVIHQMESLNEKFGLRVPLMLMNSFFTHGPTMEIVDRLGFPTMTLMQSQVPRLLQDSFSPLETCTDEDWVPPGHGDLYASLKRSKQLETLLAQGYRWAYISNLDNLAACVEPWILGLIHEEEPDFILEVTNRTNSDRKGGTPVIRNGRVQLLEIAQVGPEEKSIFQDIQRFPFFNTNNIWLDLRALAANLSQGTLDLPIIQNHKIIDGRKVVQLETAMGAALGCFDNSKVLRVGRERFFPTKKVSDLLVLRSDACTLDSMYRLRRNPVRLDSLPFMPHVFFAEDFLDSPLAMRSRFEDPASVSLVRAESLDVYGAVFFESNVTIEGRVEVRGGQSGMYSVPRGTVLRDECYPQVYSLEQREVAASDHVLYPLELSRMVVEKVWGSTSIGWGLPREVSDLPTIGELWETFDGEEDGSVILNGAHRLTPLRELIHELGASLIGTELTDYIGYPFPLLIKYLFPSQPLSIQVHPNDEYALHHEHSRGKTEMWLILNAAEESFIMVGWQSGFDRQEIVDRIYAGNFDSLLNIIQPRSGDVYFIPAGTPHALGPGVTVLEIQQNSDVTYRLHDWNRGKDSGAARSLHLKEALDVLSFDYVPEHRIPSLLVTHETGDCQYLCACRYFAACKWNLTGKTQFTCDPSRFWVLNVIAGQGSILCPGGAPLRVEQGSTVLIPAGLGTFSIEPSGTITLIKTWMPDLQKDIVAPLRESGYSESQITSLGGMGWGNDFRSALR